MLSRERVFTALDGEEPDRVPIFEIVINPKIRNEIYRGCSYTEFAENIGLDVVVAQQRVYRKKIAANTYIDEWKVVERYTGDVGLTEIKSPIASKDGLLNYTPPDPTADYRFDELRALVRKFKGKKAIAFWIRDGFSRPRRLMGMENLLISYITDPELAKRVTEISLDYNLKLLEKAIEEGTDIIISADDYAGIDGPLMSPFHFQQFVLPVLTKLVKRTHELGAKYIKHSDGNIWAILDMIVDTGIDGLHPIDPSAGLSITEVKRRYRDQICIVGNVDCKYILSEASTDEVIQEVKRLISNVAPGGGYMIASSNSIHKGVNPQNYVAMVKAAKKYGKYPITIH